MLEGFFSHFCHQSPDRSFWIAGQALPFCQRCAGFYTGAVTAALFFASFGRRQRGLAPTWLIVLNVLFVLAMGVFGFSLIEQPPLGRYATGAAFGSAIVILSWPFVLERLATVHLAAWSVADQVRYFVFLAALAGLPLAAARWEFAVVRSAWSIIGIAGLALALGLPNLLAAQLLLRASLEHRRRAAAVLVAAALVAGELVLISVW
jgi:uncharacterized membrane protein